MAIKKSLIIPKEILNGYVIYAQIHDNSGSYRQYLASIKLTYERIPDEKLSNKAKIVYTNNTKKLMPSLMECSTYWDKSLFIKTKEEVKITMEAIDIMNTVLKIKRKKVLKWNYVQVGDLLNQLKKEFALPENIVKLQ